MIRARLGALLAVVVALVALPAGGAAAAPAVDDFSVSPDVPTVGMTMTLDGTSMADPDGTALTYEWDTNDDGVYDTPGAVADVVVTDPPDHKVKTVLLRVTYPDFPEDAKVITKQIAVDHKPTAKFVRASAGTVHTNDAVTFTNQSTDADGPGPNDIQSWTWRVNGADVGGGDTTTHDLTYAFPGPGDYSVTLTVSDGQGHASTSSPQSVKVVAAPVADFTFAPTDPVVGQEITFDGQASRGPDGSEITYAWDADGDDKFDDGTDPTMTTSFATAGDHTVKLKITDGGGGGASAVTTKTVAVKGKANIAPTAGFSYAPGDPVVGQAVTFTSTSSDADGTVAKYFWDFNNDGHFAEGSASMTTTFTRVGAQTVTLKVADDAGGVATTFRTVTVRALTVTTPPPPPPPVDKAKKSSTPSTLNPFPIVRMRGLILRRGVNIQILSVRAQSGAVVTVRCAGRSCPVKRVRVKLRGKRRSVRIHRLERRLKVGTVIEIRITKKNRIGKYTRFVIRRNAAPTRRDLCIGPASNRPVRCAA